MLKLQRIRADLWQSYLNTRFVRSDASPESQGYSVMPDEAEVLRKGHLPAHWKPPITTAEVARNDVPSSDDDEAPSRVCYAWSSEDKMRMVRMRAAKVPFKIIAKKLGRTSSACQNVFFRIKIEPEFDKILKAGHDSANVDDDYDGDDKEQDCNSMQCNGDVEGR
ncbi:hypothetical protein N0V93_008803 [Gnomoniopsis smithogilvyi]|uniref:Myb-like domain-containing protein n=1 Tax=Gnomoniopsis smithogilvyi TaxID=1191159 RepID=A0A9W8YNE9_9PEZI|nr:hypothetical protein N0V93_008803 [Gnomoniopsis smithogilvyi]